MITRGKIKRYLEEMLPRGTYEIPNANNKPMWINCQVGGAILACDVFLEDGGVRTSFFWRSKKTLAEDSDADLLGMEYFDSMVNVLPKGYLVKNRGVKEGFRWEKDYGDKQDAKEIAKEIVCVFHSFGPFARLCKDCAHIAR